MKRYNQAFSQVITIIHSKHEGLRLKYDRIQLRLLWETAHDNSESQTKMIKEQSLDSLERSTEVNLTQTAGATCSGYF